MLLLIRRLLSSGQDLKNHELRKKFGTISGVIGILLNLMLFTIKLLIALTTGAISVIADAFNNLMDAASSVVTIIGFRLSGKARDPEHPFGHGRVEYVTGFVISVVIILMGFELGKSSIQRIISPEVVEFSSVTVITLAASVVLKLYMSLYNNRLNAVLDSPALKATALDSLSDAVATFAVLVALVISKLTSLELDAWAGALVSGFIIYTGINTARETLNPLLGTPPKPELVAEIERMVMAQAPIVGMHDLIVHDYGPGRLLISLHAEVPADTDIFLAHDAIDNLEMALSHALGCEAVIHIDPIDTNDEELRKMYEVISGIVKTIHMGLEIHDFRRVPGETHTNLLFDVVVPLNLIVGDKKLKDRICELVAEEFPQHNCVIKIDHARVL